ncbi:HNH endonuclease [Pseudomonas mandelii]|uniref:HNH endonuclease n=2 Tax=Pseudomonas mandelii TaxID=75612 RepID=A0AB36CPH2_9PSED|nr:HNH endonuclease [Pseudomonas mandelii]NMZ77816.1 HNH endonuclease [Pseudomonas mandelii]
MRTRFFSESVLQKELESAEKTAENEGDFDFINEPDARARISRAIVLRRGQGAFRRALIEAYEGTCAVTGCTALDVLEAAHIVPYRGEHTNRVDNGLLLRGDIHTLFDLGHLWIEEGNIHLAVHLLDTEYGKLNNRKLRLPRKKTDSPSADALAHHALETKKIAGIVTELLQEQA